MSQQNIDDLRNSISLTASLCHQWATAYKRRGAMPILTVDDVMQCAAKFYFLHVFDPNPSCKNLQYMEHGKAILQAIEPVLTGLNLKAKIPYFTRMIPYGMNLKPIEITLVSVPDFVDQAIKPKFVVNVKTHHQNKKIVSYTTNEQVNFYEHVAGGTLPIPYVTLRKNPPGTDYGTYDPDTYEQYGSRFPAYISDWIELAALDQFAHKGQIARSLPINTRRTMKMLTVAMDGQFEQQIVSTQLGPLFEMFTDELLLTVYAFHYAITHKAFDKDIFQQLLMNEIVYGGIIKAYQCRDCPAFGMGYCSGMPLLRKHRIRDDGVLDGDTRAANMVAFVNWWADRGIELPEPPEFTENEPFINEQAHDVGTRGRLTRTGWADTVRWTQQVRIALAAAHRQISFMLDMEGLGYNDELEATVKQFL